MKRIYLEAILYLGILVLVIIAGVAIFTQDNGVKAVVVKSPVVAKGKPRFSGYFIAYPDGGYVGVPEPSLYFTLKDRVKDKAILRQFECWTNTDGKTTYDEYNNTEDWTYCKVRTISK